MASTAVPARNSSLDSFRGIILVLMALDHAAYFIAKHHPAEFWGLPLPDHSNGVSLMIRVVTHVCAPGFFLLLGIGAVLFRQRRLEAGWTESRIARALITRGLILILVNQVLENPAWIVGSLVPDASAWAFSGAVPGGTMPVRMGLGVLTALGVALIVSSVAVRLAPSVLLIAAGTIIGAIFAYTLNLSGPDADIGYVTRVLLVAGQTGPLLVLYPVVAWLPFGLVGIATATSLADRAGSERSTGALNVAAAVAVVAALVGQLAGGIGDFHAARAGISGILNLTKYPPSPAFAALYGGLAILLLAACRAEAVHRIAWLREMGTAPLFFYLTHIWLFMLVGLAFPSGGSEWLAIIGWAGLTPALVVLAARFGRFKRRQPLTSRWRYL